MEDSNIQIQSMEGTIVEFDQNIKKLTKYFEDQQSDQIHLENVPTHALEFIKKLLEAHNYSDENVKWVYPWKNGNLREHIDGVSYELLKVYDKTGKSREEMEDCVELGQILQGLVILGLTKFRKVANTTLQIPWYCGETDQQIQDYKNFWGWKELDFQQDKVKYDEAMAFIDEMREIRKQHSPIFDKIAEEYQKNMDQIINQAEQQQQEQQQ